MSEIPPMIPSIADAQPGPIADLSYRNYDGPLNVRLFRWWIVAVAGLRLAIKKKGFWIVAAISILPYLIIGLTLYLSSSGVNTTLSPVPVGQKYSSQFFQAAGLQSLWLFIIAVLVGSSSIAADNQANALMVYLSKPITKGDYLLGKWMSTFLAVTAVALVPSILLYFYCLLSFQSAGFLKEEPWLFLRVIGAATIPGIVHASLIVGISAWSKTPRMAGAIYAGLYFMSFALATMVWAIAFQGDLSEGVMVRHLAIGTAIQGVEQNIYSVDVRQPGMRRRRQNKKKAGQTGQPQMDLAIEIPVPNVGPMVLLVGSYCVVGVMAARSRIRAVEVVKG
ncbi:MAG: ABC transporter permease subunit [Chthonomonadales bacterium]